MDYEQKYKELVEAIEYYTILWEFTLDKNNPRKSIKHLLDIETSCAVDPQVSKKARALLLVDPSSPPDDLKTIVEFAIHEKKTV